MDQTQDAFDLVAMAIEIVEPIIRRARVARAAPAPLLLHKRLNKKVFSKYAADRAGFQLEVPGDIADSGGIRSFFVAGLCHIARRTFPRMQMISTWRLAPPPAPRWKSN